MQTDSSEFQLHPFEEAYCGVVEIKHHSKEAVREILWAAAAGVHFVVTGMQIAAVCNQKSQEKAWYSWGISLIFAVLEIKRFHTCKAMQRQLVVDLHPDPAVPNIAVRDWQPNQCCVMTLRPSLSRSTVTLLHKLSNLWQPRTSFSPLPRTSLGSYNHCCGTSVVWQCAFLQPHSL